MESSSALPSMDVEQEVKCPICREYLTDPVTLDCGHNFCRGCIYQYCQTWEDLGDLQCPLCLAKIKKGNFRRNWQLANITEKIKCLSFNLEKHHLCVRHTEKLHLFCKEDQELLCLFCERSPQHQSHTILLLEEAAKECKDQLCSYLEVLRKERERILDYKAGTEKESQDLLGQIKEKKTRTVDVFNQLNQFLEEQKTFLLSQLEELEKETVTRREKHMAKLIKELACLEDLIQQMEEKCQQPASELLQDIRRTLERYEKKEVFQNPVVFNLLTNRIRGFHDVKPLLEGVIKQVERVIKQANVTLDPDTAGCLLILSEDRKSVRWSPRPQAVPDNPERFDVGTYVLGLEGYTAGTHFWEVTVGSAEKWAVGVARKSVRRKCFNRFRIQDGIWAIGKWEGQYKASISSDLPHLEWKSEEFGIYSEPSFCILDYIPIIFSQVVKRIRVTLKCAEGEVFFSDADTESPIYTYSGASFCGETLLPFFYVEDDAHLTLSS